MKLCTLFVLASQIFGFLCISLGKSPIFHSRVRRARTDGRWPSTLETMQFNEGKFNMKTSASMTSQSTVSTIADNIKCIKQNNIQKFTSSITLPNGYSIEPIFEELTEAASECSIKPISGSTKQFQMKITDFAKCGVKSEKGTDGKEWVSISLRFPMLRGLQTMEDEHILIICRPQEPVITKQRALDFRTNIVRPPRTVFSGGSQDMEIRMGLFAKPPGMTYFSEEIPVDGIIEIGEELQFRAIVRPGDGWNYARLKDLKVMRIDGGTRSKNNSREVDENGSVIKGKMTGQSDVISLVQDDGCRNPVYSALAPFHPYRDTSNTLAVAFNFKAFMFQDMPDDGVIRITAKIMACVEEIDCAPSLCLDNGQQGYGRRKRSIPESKNEHKSNFLDTFLSEGNSTYNESILSDFDPREERSGSGFDGSITKETSNFAGNFRVKVVLPGYAKRTSMNLMIPSKRGPICQPVESSCKTVIIMISSIAALLCSSITLAAICALRVRAKSIY